MNSKFFWIFTLLVVICFSLAQSSKLSKTSILKEKMDQLNVQMWRYCYKNFKVHGHRYRTRYICGTNIKKQRGKYWCLKTEHGIITRIKCNNPFEQEIDPKIHRIIASRYKKIVQFQGHRKIVKRYKECDYFVFKNGKRYIRRVPCKLLKRRSAIKTPYKNRTYKYKKNYNGPISIKRKVPVHPHSHYNYPYPQPDQYPGHPISGKFPRYSHPGKFPGYPQQGNFPGYPHPGKFPGYPQPGQFPGYPQPGKFPGYPQPGQYPGHPQSGQFPGYSHSHGRKSTSSNKTKVPKKIQKNKTVEPKKKVTIKVTKPTPAKPKKETPKEVVKKQVQKLKRVYYPFGYKPIKRDFKIIRKCKKITDGKCRWTNVNTRPGYGFCRCVRKFK